MHPVLLRNPAWCWLKTTLKLKRDIRGVRHYDLPRNVQRIIHNRRSFHAAASSEQKEEGGSMTVKIGTVERQLPTNQTPDERAKIPSGYLLHDDEQLPPEFLSHLQWMMQKDQLGQDMLLVGHCAVQRRRLVMSYAQLTQRPVQVLTISSDTTESDLKQKRHLRHGSSSSNEEEKPVIVFENQAPVRAALEGHLLVLDNLQFAERNVLPTLNNLLENRELNLEDGRLLVSHDRYQHLQQQNNNAGGGMNDFLVPVCPDFRVVALFRPDLEKLDPPLRSRFQIRRVDPTLKNHHQYERRREGNTTSNPKITKRNEKALNLFGETMLLSPDDETKKLHFPVTTAMPAVSRVVSHFPRTPLQDALARAFPYAPSSSSSSSDRWSRVVEHWPTGQEARQHFQRVAQEVIGVNIAGRKNNNVVHYYRVDQVQSIPGDPFHVRVKFESNDGAAVEVSVPSGGRGLTSSSTSSSSSSHFVSTLASQQALTSMMQEHFAGRDLLLVSPKGEGKSILAQHFAGLLGYETYLFPLYKEMAASDLLYRRTSSSSSKNGNTLSPLLQSARKGQICILDGLEKLSRDTLASLQGLLTDREVHLPDGTKLAGDAIHPSFRVIGLASYGNSRSAAPTWLTEELISMFSTILLSQPTRECLGYILESRSKVSNTVLDKILDCHERLMESATDCGVSPLSIRTMLRLVRHSNNDNLHEHLSSVLLAELLLPAQRATLESIFRSSGVSFPKNRKQRRRRERETRLDVKVGDTNLTIGDFTMARPKAKNANLVPSPYFFDIPSHVRMIQTLLTEWQMGERAFLLLGNQGTGKNKICDRLCQLANFEREYIQLHRDSTIGQLTLSPSLEDGKIIWKDSPLVRAVSEGRALVIDEADKAPLEVVAVLKSLVEDGELLLADGRRILRNTSEDDAGKFSSELQ